MRILYLDLDTLRPDHLGCYGYQRDTSPNIDRIAAEGMRFESCYCSDAPCLPSRAALTTGQFGIHNGVVNHGGTCADRPPDGINRGFRDTLSTGGSLVNVLRDAGLHCCYFGGFGERHSAYWYYAGFHEIHDTAGYGMESAENVTPGVLDWIHRNGARDNWYLHINYWDAHTPYRAPETFGNPFADTPLPHWMTPELLARHRQMAGPHTAQDINMYNNKTDPAYPRHPGELTDMAAFRTLMDGYDCGIRYMDAHIGQLFDALARHNILDELVVVISADHGENFGELGIYAEHGTADHATCRVPFIVRWPGLVDAGTRDTGLHYQLDWLPTLAELLDRPAKPWWDGQSFAATLRNGADTGRSMLVLSQCCHVCQRSVRWGDYLYMRTWHDGFHLFPDEQLYNLADDPQEQQDIAAVQPALRQQGADYLAHWHEEMLASMPEGRTQDPLQVVLEEGGPFHARGHLRSYLERLKSSGRAEAAAELARRHPSELRD